MADSLTIDPSTLLLVHLDRCEDVPTNEKTNADVGGLTIVRMFFEDSNGVINTHGPVAEWDYRRGKNPVWNSKRLLVLPDGSSLGNNSKNLKLNVELRSFVKGESTDDVLFAATKIPAVNLNVSSFSADTRAVNKQSVGFELDISLPQLGSGSSPRVVLSARTLPAHIGTGVGSK